MSHDINTTILYQLEVIASLGTSQYTMYSKIYSIKLIYFFHIAYSKRCQAFIEISSLHEDVIGLILQSKYECKGVLFTFILFT
jgi:hypothetical protein